MSLKRIKEIISIINDKGKLTIYEELLLSALEGLLALYEEQKQEIQKLKDEIKALKNEKGKPKINPNTKRNRDFSSENERSKPKKHKKSSKNAKIAIHRTEVRRVNRAVLPKDAVFKGYNKVIIQNIKIVPDNICFKLEVFYSPSEKKTYSADIDKEYSGSQFSPELKAFIVDLYYQGRMTEPIISRFLKDKGIIISKGTISNILTKKLDIFHSEKEKVYQAGLQSNIYQHTDDTGARHKGKTCSTMIVCNEYYTIFLTSNSKSRLQVLRNLCGGELKYRFNEKTISLLEKEKLNSWICAGLTGLYGRSFSKPDNLKKALLKQLGNENLLPTENQWKKILFVSAYVFYTEQTEYMPVKILVCDDAGQFKKLSVRLQLCWIHSARNFKVLNPYSNNYRKILKVFLNDFWKYYKRLEAYRNNPDMETKKKLAEDFDKLFSQRTGYAALDKLLSIKLSKKRYYLTVLDYPEVPIHNNPAEEQIRGMVIKRKISSGTRSEEGKKARDTFTSLMLTCRKLGLNYFDYLKDRFRKEWKIPALDEIILKKRNCHAGFT